MSYATIDDIEARTGKTLSTSERAVATALLEDAATIIDAYNSDANADAKKVVSCRMVIRSMQSGVDVPIGATQGSMSALGYSQSWTMSNGSTGELYIGRTEKKILGAGNKIGSYSPVEALA